MRGVESLLRRQRSQVRAEAPRCESRMRPNCPSPRRARIAKRPQLNPVGRIDVRASPARLSGPAGLFLVQLSSGIVSRQHATSLTRSRIAASAFSLRQDPSGSFFQTALVNLWRDAHGGIDAEPTRATPGDHVVGDMPFEQTVAVEVGVEGRAQRRAPRKRSFADGGSRYVSVVLGATRLRQSLPPFVLDADHRRSLLERQCALFVSKLCPRRR